MKPRPSCRGMVAWKREGCLTAVWRPPYRLSPIVALLPQPNDGTCSMSLIKRLVPLQTRNFIRLLLRRHPIEQRQYWPDLEMMKLRRNDVIIDVGANAGRFVETALAFQPYARVHAFEPIPDVYAELLKKVGAYANVCCHNLALGSAPGTQALNISKYHEASSFLDLGSTLMAGVRGIDFSFENVLTVEVDTLTDYVLRRDIGKIKLLKMDVQGYEIEVLKGAEAILTRVEYIYTEAQFQELYKDG